MFVGMGAAKVRDLFKEADKKHPALSSLMKSILLARSVETEAFLKRRTGANTEPVVNRDGRVR